MSQTNWTVPPGANNGWVRGYTDSNVQIPMYAWPDPANSNRVAFRQQDDDGVPTEVALNCEYHAGGYATLKFRYTLPPAGGSVEGDYNGTASSTLPLQPDFPVAPGRDTVLNGQITMQGLMVDTAQFGPMPWYGEAWAWLTQADRASVAKQLLAAGDEVTIVGLPDGHALYDEPAPNFFSPDKFPPLLWTDAQFIALLQELLGYGFKALWVFLGGDDGAAGYPVAVEQTQRLSPQFTAAGLAPYILQSPGWDGVFYGYTPQQVSDFAAIARAAGCLYVGMEQQTGHIPVGNGPGDYAPGGLMTGYDLILGEFGDGEFDDTVWQILGRMVRPYVRPANQPSGDDTNPPYYLGTPSPRGPFVYRVFEYYIYGWVRGTQPSVVADAKAQFAAMAPGNAIC